MSKRKVYVDPAWFRENHDREDKPFVYRVLTDEEIWPARRRLSDEEIVANLEADAGVIHFSEDATSLPTGWLGQ